MMPRLASGSRLDRFLDRIFARIDRDEGEFPTREFGALVSVLVMLVIFFVVMIVPVLDAEVLR